MSQKGTIKRRKIIGQGKNAYSLMDMAKSVKKISG
jgi:hypothetical protein